MTSETARLVVYVGFAVGLVVWLWGLLRARAMLSWGAEPSVELSRVEVDGDAEEVSRELARAVTGQGGPILAGFCVAYVVDAPTAGVRGQAFQIVQAGHLLWPPFLLQYVGRRTQGLASVALMQVVQRLQYR